MVFLSMALAMDFSRNQFQRMKVFLIAFLPLLLAKTEEVLFAPDQ